MKNKITIVLLFISLIVNAQIKVKDTTIRRATIVYSKDGKVISFKSQNPPLTQISGAPPANYSHFWEFGDGSFSKENEPKKTYKKQGNYKINLSVTNNYDNGKPPATRPKTVVVTENSDDVKSDIASLEKQEGYQIFASREPSPEEEMIVVVGYQNLLNYVTNGKLYLFYNDKEFKKKNFDLIEMRTHFGEREVLDNNLAYAENKNESYKDVAADSEFSNFKNPFLNDDENLETTLEESRKAFNDVKVLDFDLMNPNETRNVFFTFKTTPEMVKDTSATVKMRGVFVPDRSYKTHKKRTLEMEIVTSHDPNKMSSNAAFMNYRLVRFKTITMKTRFQNDGEGPAKTIRLETDIPKMFDKNTFKVVDMYPKCPICPKGETVTYSCLDTIIKKDQIHFIFKNIYLPGSQQKNVKEKDSTKGFVQYSMKFAKDFHKISTKSKTSIFFDKNEPVITNYARTRFLPGISIGAKTGYNLYSNLENARSYFVSATVSPYKSYRWYWQVELQNNFTKYNSETSVVNELINNSVQPTGQKQLQTTTSQTKFENYTVEIPVLIRYNINNFIGFGAGIQGNLNVTSSQSTASKVETYEGITPTILIKTVTDNSGTSTSNFKDFKGGFILDATFGFSRIGPSLGTRYVLNSDKGFNYWQFYGIWKF